MALEEGVSLGLGCGELGGKYLGEEGAGGGEEPGGENEGGFESEHLDCVCLFGLKVDRGFERYIGVLMENK